MSDDAFDSDQIPCSYCGKEIYADSPRCPKCGNYTDGLGTFETPLRSKHRLPLVFVIGGWLALFGMLVPIYFMVERLLKWLIYSQR